MALVNEEKLAKVKHLYNILYGQYSHNNRQQPKQSNEHTPVKTAQPQKLIFVALLLWVQLQWNLTLVHSLLVLAATNLVLAGISLRVGGQLLKAPFLPQTLEGLSRTVRALLGRD